MLNARDRCRLKGGLFYEGDVQRLDVVFDRAFLQSYMSMTEMCCQTSAPATFHNQVHVGKGFPPKTRVCGRERERINFNMLNIEPE